MKNINSILFVDDDFDDCEIFQDAITNIYPSIKVEFAMNGLDALKKLQKSDIKPDIIFSDLKMPLMGGMEMLTKIKDFDNLKNIPFVIYSTSLDGIEKEISGVIYAIVKPTGFEQICKEIKYSIELV